MIEVPSLPSCPIAIDFVYAKSSGNQSRQVV